MVTIICILGYKPWCSTKVDANGNHISGGKNWGVCDDQDNCPIPPRYCGEPIRTRGLPDDRDDNVEIIQMPWMASLGGYEKYDWICLIAHCNRNHATSSKRERLECFI